MALKRFLHDWRKATLAIPLTVTILLALAVAGFAVHHAYQYRALSDDDTKHHRSVTAFQFTNLFDQMVQASYRFELNDASMPEEQVIWRAQKLNIHIDNLRVGTYADAILRSELEQEFAELKHVSSQIDVFISGAAQGLPVGFAQSLEDMRPSVERIARAVHQENDRMSVQMRDALRRDSLSIFAFAMLFLLSVAFLVPVEWKRRQNLIAKTRALELSEAKLRDLSFYRQQFLANMSHEFRTPLNAIQGFSEAILYQKDTIKTEKVIEYVDIVARSAKDLAKLTEDVLDMSKIDAGKFDITREEVDFTDLFDETIIQFNSVAAQRDIAIKQSVEADWTVFCDRFAIKRCITNVLSNALKFSDNGGAIYIDAYLRDNSLLVVEVRDVGCGIPERDLQSIWMVYARSSLTRKSDREGAGLGLAMVKALMDAHNGFVELQSREGIGTSVRLCFPLTMVVKSSLGDRGDTASSYRKAS